MTAVIVNVNKRYKAHAGLRVTGLRVTGEIRIIPLEGIPEVEDGDDLVALLADAASAPAGSRTPTSSSSPRRSSRRPRDASCGWTRSSRPSARSSSPTTATHATSRRYCGRASRSSASGRRSIIAETRHGFVCASAGVDASNAKGEGTLVLLPLDPDASAARHA